MRPTPTNAGWHPDQIKVVHIYASQARLTDPEYRSLLQAYTCLDWSHAGAITSKDRRLTQLDFDRFIVELERLLWQRVDAGRAAPPTGRYSHRDYWAHRCGALGMMSSRQRHRLEILWADLRASLGLPDTDAYLDGIARHATDGTLAHWREADSAQAWRLIEALSDRLRHARNQELAV